MLLIMDGAPDSTPDIWPKCSALDSMLQVVEPCATQRRDGLIPWHVLQAHLMPCRHNYHACEQHSHCCTTQRKTLCLLQALCRQMSAWWRL